MTKQNSIFKLFKSVEFIYILGCLSSLVIPWFLSVSPSISDSYYYGFSNKAGLCILLVTIAICFFMLCKNSSTWLIKHFDTNEYFSNLGNKGFELRFKSIYIIAGIIFILFLYLINRTGRTINYGESAYFIQRLYLMQDGLKPYIDFEFAYGSLLLYFPFFLINLLKLSIPAAYQISLFVEVLIGYYSLWYLCKKVSNSQFINKIFFLLFVPTYILTFMGGVNYTLFRFATPLVLILGVFQKIYIKPTVIKNIFYSFCVFFLIFIISPEIAVTSTLALFGCFVFANSFSFKSFLMCIPSIVILLTVSTFVKFINNSFITLYIFSQGGNNFPWFVSPTILAFLLFIYFSLVVLFSNKKKDFNNPQIIIFVISILNLPGAMGRCDAGHLFLYGFGFFLISLSAVPYILTNKLRILISMSYKFIFFVLIIIGTTYLYKPYFGWYVTNILNNYSISIRSHKNIIESSNRVLNQKDNLQIDSLIMYSDSKPLVLSSIPVFFENSILRNKIDFPYFINGKNKLSIYSNEVLIKEILKHNIILAPQDKEWLCGFSPLTKTTMFFLFGIPPFYNNKNKPEFINEKICSAIDNNFVIDTSMRVKDFTVYKKKQSFR
jgi:hypothetical protein